MKTPEFHILPDTKIEEFLALAELGRQAQVIFHDLANHFTSLNLTICELENNLAAEKDRFREYSRRSNETRAQVEHVANLLRSHIQGKNEPFKANKIIADVVELLDDKIKRAGANIVLKLDKNIGFQTGKREFIHIVTNLISNAVESIDPNSTKTKNVTMVLEQNAQQILLSISDTGSGIKKENHERIFTHGFTTKKMGNGIGLSAIKQTVENTFRGKISFQSKKGSTQFKIVIPKQNRKRISPPVLKKNLDFRLQGKSLKRLTNERAI